MRKPILKVDWATHKSAKYACANWHYSGNVPVSKIVRLGTWEDDSFKGVVIFGIGATPQLFKPYGLQPAEGCELARVALRDHVTPVSKIIKVALIYLRRANPNLRLVVSYADEGQGHHGGIYQAGNWIYDGESVANWISINGEKIHPRTAVHRYGTSSITKLTQLGLNAKKVKSAKKHRYLMPLDKAMREQIKPLSKPYPKRTKLGDACDQRDSGGATPTSALHYCKGET